MIRKFILPFIIIQFLQSCISNGQEQVENFKTLISDTSITHRPNFEINFSKNQSEILNLPILVNGVDSFELRVWTFGFVTRKDLFILRYSQNKWTSTYYRYYKTENIIDSLNLLSKEVKNDKATLIQNFLIQDSILNLPTQIAIPNFTDNTADGETTYIEIATSKFYKQISYHNPQYFNEPNNKQFLKILNKIKIYY